MLPDRVGESGVNADKWCEAVPCARKQSTRSEFTRQRHPSAGGVCAHLEFAVTQAAPQKNIASAGKVRMPTTTFVLSNLACRFQGLGPVLHADQRH